MLFFFITSRLSVTFQLPDINYTHVVH